MLLLNSFVYSFYGFSKGCLHAYRYPQFTDPLTMYSFVFIIIVCCMQNAKGQMKVWVLYHIVKSWWCFANIWIVEKLPLSALVVDYYYILLLFKFCSLNFCLCVSFSTDIKSCSENDHFPFVFQPQNRFVQSAKNHTYMLHTKLNPHNFVAIYSIQNNIFRQ